MSVPRDSARSCEGIPGRGHPGWFSGNASQKPWPLRKPWKGKLGLQTVDRMGVKGARTVGVWAGFPKRSQRGDLK